MDHKIQPERILKPIQLLGAWLAGLLAIDSCFLIAATRMPTGTWESQALTIAAIANVPLFLLAVFLLQTKFRPELQEDLYYSSYINQKTNAPVQLTKEDAALLGVQQRLDRIEKSAVAAISPQAESDATQLLRSLKFGINRHLEDREQIAKRLAKIGSLGYAPFGPSNEPPSKRVVSVSRHLPEDAVRAVLQLASQLGFRQFTYFDNAFEEIDEEVLLGSYGEGEYEIAEPDA